MSCSEGCARLGILYWLRFSLLAFPAMFFSSWGCRVASMPFEVHLYYFCPNDVSLVRWLHSKIGFQACTAHLLLRFEVYAYSARNDEAHCGDTNPNQVLQVSSFFSVCLRHWVLRFAARSIPVMFIFVPNTTTNNPDASCDFTHVYLRLFWALSNPNQGVLMAILAWLKASKCFY